MTEQRQKDELFGIAKAAERAGVSTQTIRYYLMVGLIKEADSTPTGRKLFNEQIVRRIRLIKRLNETGYSLREIREIFLKNRT